MADRGVWRLVVLVVLVDHARFPALGGRGWLVLVGWLVGVVASRGVVGVAGR